MRYFQKEKIEMDILRNPEKITYSFKVCILRDDYTTG